MSPITPPNERKCLRCGRLEEWDDDNTVWVAATVDGEPQRGTRHCVHEWNVTGTYNPITPQ